ncbi:hypothetical protein AMELA_G00175420 [Ameiurus melas]|uniref:Reverse transcriptase domain-containing protein n=1 Tax=Ameiurus melas TaxID=219545 RepID=A0A7J6AG44_AMEME|nr:hypothetical protein AMELA_G00175420 [Ameiurus melas]
MQLTFLLSFSFSLSSSSSPHQQPTKPGNSLTSSSHNNLLDTKQSGFKSNHSMETALLSVTEALRLARATSRSSVLILLDLSAAFDTVNHQILLSTLSNLGITGMILCWVESYLSDRSFKVSWSGGISETQQLTTGVPQGSVLGPLACQTSRSG